MFRNALSVILFFPDLLAAVAVMAVIAVASLYIVGVQCVLELFPGKDSK
jgi:hypothetical protein